METVLVIVQDGFKFDLKLFEKLNEKRKVYVAEGIDHAEEIVRENNIDIFIVIMNGQITSSMWRFINKIHEMHSEMTPFIFAYEKMTPELNEQAIERSSWFCVPYPIDHERLLNVIEKRAMKLVSMLDVKTIMLKTEREGKIIPIRTIRRVDRYKTKNIIVHRRDPETLEETKELYTYGFSLANFLKEHGLERYFKQANQHCLLNVADVDLVQSGKMKIVLKDGTIISTSRKHIKNFKI